MIYGIIAGIAILIALAVQIDYVFGLVVAILIFCGMIGLGIYANVADDPFGEKRRLRKNSLNSRLNNRNAVRKCMPLS